VHAKHHTRANGAVETILSEEDVWSQGAKSEQATSSCMIGSGNASGVRPANRRAAPGGERCLRAYANRWISLSSWWRPFQIGGKPVTC